MAPGDSPEGWAARNYPTSVVGIQVFKCDRMRVGSFERPASILIESHNRSDPPASCQRDEVGISRILQAIWTNDTEIGAFLAQEFGIPVYVGNISHSITAGAALLTQHRWEWGFNGTTSWVTYNSTEADQRTYLQGIRYYWQVGDGVSYMNYRENLVAPGADTNVILGGRMEPPMLYARSPMGPYHAQANLAYDLSFEGEVIRFQDLQCEKPFP